MNNIEYRNLEYDDVPALNSLIDKSKSHLGIKSSDELLKNLKHSALKKLLNADIQMVGAFENDAAGSQAGNVRVFEYVTSNSN